MFSTLRFGFLALAAASLVSASNVGVATFFAQNNLAGACGIVHSDSDSIAAISIALYGTAFESPLCGHLISITNPANNKSVIAQVADECIFCQGIDDLDLSFGAFDAIANREDGEVDVVWNFV